jgi:hypothetical protein
LEKYWQREQKRNKSRASFRPATAVPADPESQPTPEPDRLEVATDQAIAAWGGDARSAVKALIVAIESLETQVADLKAAVSNGFARDRFELSRATARIGTIEQASHGRDYIFRGVAVRCH